jgi:hypothetical protein
MSVAVGLCPRKDVTLVPARDSMMASRVDIACWRLMPVG